MIEITELKGLAETSASASTTDTRPAKRIKTDHIPALSRIEILDHDFDTMWNLLYYLYTCKVNLFIVEPSLNIPGFPNKVDGFALYRAAIT